MLGSRISGSVGRPLLLRGATVILALMLAVASAQADNGYQMADGLAIYLGIVPASVVRGHPSSHAERTMHGGAGTQRHQQHIIVAVFDAETGKRIENADIEATIAGLGHVGHQRIKLEPMTIANTITYGAFVNLSGDDRYEIAIDIVVRDRSRPVSAKFTIEHFR